MAALWGGAAVAVCGEGAVWAVGRELCEGGPGVCVAVCLGGGCVEEGAMCLILLLTQVLL